MSFLRLLALSSVWILVAGMHLCAGAYNIVAPLK